MFAVTVIGTHCFAVFVFDLSASAVIACQDRSIRPWSFPPFVGPTIFEMAPLLWPTHPFARPKIDKHQQLSIRLVVHTVKFESISISWQWHVQCLPRPSLGTHSRWSVSYGCPQCEWTQPTLLPLPARAKFAGQTETKIVSKNTHTTFVLWSTVCRAKKASWP